MSCKTIKVKKITTTNTTTAETVEGVFVFEDINFPTNPETGSIHIVQFDDGLYVYEYINFIWSLKITNLDNVGKTHSVGDSEDDYSGQFPDVDGEVIGDTYTIQYADGTVVHYRWDGAVWLDIFIQTYVYTQHGNKTGLTDVLGDIVTTFATAFSSTPSSIVITSRGTTPYVYNVTARSTSTFTTRVFDMAGAAVLTTAVDFDWTAAK